MASSRRGPATMPGTNLRWRTSKRVVRSRVGKGQSRPPARHSHRDMVPGRSADRPEKQDHTPLGQARHAAVGAQGPVDEIGLYLRRDLSRSWQGRGAGAAILFCNTETKALHLAEISLAVAPGAHAVLLMDQAGWHSCITLSTISRKASGSCVINSLTAVIAGLTSLLVVAGLLGDVEHHQPAMTASLPKRFCRTWRTLPSHPARAWSQFTCNAAGFVIWRA